MRILHIITNLETGGAEKLMVDLLPKLKDGHDKVELLLLDGKRTPFYELLEKQGVTIHVLGHIKNVYHPIYLWRMWMFLKKNKYDIIHTHNTAPQIFAAVCKVLCSVVLCTTEHNTSNRRRDLKWYRPIDKWMYSKYDKIICISDAAEKNLRDYMHLYDDDRICTIYNGVNVMNYMEAKPATELKSVNGRKVIVMVARFSYQKDQDTLIKAISLLPETEFELWLIGTGERKEELEKLSKKMGVENRVRFLGVRMDVPNVLKSADFVVMSSHFEGLSLSNIEGMASGSPFIASDVDGLREVTKGYGLLFPHQDARALANVIVKLSNNKALYDETIQKCHERALHFDISVMAKNYHAVYAKLINI